MESSHRIRAILSFVQAADAGSFAAAARVLGVSSAAVSKNVAGLEAALGVRLMNRTTRSLTLTEEGIAFLAQARVALAALEAAADTVAAQRVEPSGRVRISTSLAFGREQLMPALPGLMERYPGVSVEIDFDDRVVDLVSEGYDFALRGGTPRDSALVSRPVCRLHMALVASPDYLARHGVPRNPKELPEHRLIARRFLGGKVAAWNFRGREGHESSLDPSPASVLTLSAPETVVQAACAGLGIAQVGVHLAWEHLVAGRLKVVLLRHHHPGSYEMALQYPHRALIALLFRAVLDYLTEALAGDESLHVPLSALKSYAA